MSPLARGCADFVGEIHRPLAVIVLSIGIVVLCFRWPPTVELAAVLAVPAGVLSWLVQARSSENKTQIKANAEVAKVTNGNGA